MINPTGSIFSQKRHNLDASTTGAEYTLGNRHQSRCDCLLPIQPEQELPGMTSTEKWMHPTRAEPPAQRNLRCDATNSLENCPEKRLGSSIRYMALNFSTIDINIFSTNTPSNGSTFPFQSHAAACPTEPPRRQPIQGVQLKSLLKNLPPHPISSPKPTASPCQNPTRAKRRYSHLKSILLSPLTTPPRSTDCLDHGCLA